MLLKNEIEFILNNSARMGEKELAKNANCTTQTVRNYRRRYGLPHHRLTWTDDMMRNVARLYKEGWTRKQIAMEYDTTGENINFRLTMLRKQGKI